MEAGNTVRLIAKTRKGKNKIREAGTDVWFVREVSWSPWQQCNLARLEPEGVSDKIRDEKFRWAKQKDDPDFDFEVI